jgi:cell wall-associated NlpC family hydrolase
VKNRQNIPLTSALAVSMVALAISITACASHAPVTYPGSATLLPGTAPEMTTAGYWIGRNETVDETILDLQGIADFNQSLREKKLVRDLARWEAPSPLELRKSLEDTVAWIASLKVYDEEGHRVSEKFLSPIRGLMAIDEIGTTPNAIPAQYCFTVDKTDLRVLPTNEPLYDAPYDLYIDNLQASSLEAGTAVVITHKSRDGAWLYSTTARASGWLPATSVAFASSRDEFIERLERPRFFTVLEAKADLYADAARTVFVRSIRMGSRLAAPDPARLSEANQATLPTTPAEAKLSALPVTLPIRASDGSLAETILWVASEDVTERFLPFTARTVYAQAFKLLNAPYGWGGTFGEQDCSQFLCEIFDTTGITLPRNSTKQAKAGPLIPGIAGADDAQKATLLASLAKPAATLLRFPGHIMLYLGTVDGKPYAIHATFGYRERVRGKDRVRLINRVVVSNLELGSGTERGAHLHRLTDAVLIATEKPAPEPSPELEPVQ